MSSPDEPLTRERAFLELARRAFSEPVETPPFLLSYKNFAAGINLFNLWAQEFERSRSRAVQRTRLLEFLHCWMSSYPTDLSSREHKRIITLLSTMEHHDEAIVSEFKRLISIENTTKLKRLISRQAQASSTSPSHSPSNSIDDLKSPNNSPPGSTIFAPLGFPSGSTGSPPLSPSTKPRQRGASVRNWLHRNRKNTGDTKEMANAAAATAEGRGDGGMPKLSRSNGDVTTSLDAPVRDEADFMVLGSLDIARELTMLEFEIFKNIGPRELLNQCWQKENKTVIAPSITKLIVKFNEVSYWVATEILRRADPREQARVIGKFIKIARICYQLYNFNSLSEILTGLNNSAVIRLKVAWLCVPDRSMKQFQQLDQLMQPQANYLHYRHEIRRLTFTKRERRPNAPSGLATVSSDSSLQTSLSLDELLITGAGGSHSSDVPSTLHASNSSSALPTCNSSSSILSSFSASFNSATSPRTALPPPSTPFSSPLSPGRTRPAAAGDRPLPEVQSDDPSSITSPPSSPLTKRVAHLRDDGGCGGQDDGAKDRTTPSGAAPSSQDRTSFLPRAPLSPRSPRSQWTVEIGSNRETADRDTGSPRLERSITSPRGSESDLAKTKLHLMGDNIALPRQPLENRDKYFLAEVGASTRVLMSASASSSLSGTSTSTTSSGGGSSSGQASMAASFSTSSSATGLVARGVPPILPYLAIILRDFIAVSEGNATYTKDGWVNSHLIDLQYQIVGEMKNFQSNPYSLPRKESIRKYLESLQFEDDDDVLYAMSLKSCPIAQPLTLHLEANTRQEGDSTLNADKAQEYFDAAMNGDTVSEVLKKGEVASLGSQSQQRGRASSGGYETVGGGGAITRERNASIAFYAMLSQGTAGMLERELSHLKRSETYSSTPQPPRKMSTGGGGGGSHIFRSRETALWAAEITLSGTSESDNGFSDSERELGGSGSVDGLHDAPSSSTLKVSGGGKSRGKGRPKSLQPWGSAELEVSGSLRDRSNSAITEKQKEHDEEHRWRKQMIKGGARSLFDEPYDDDDIDVIRERPRAGSESDDDGSNNDAETESSVVGGLRLTRSNSMRTGTGGKPLKSLKQLKERILSFRKIDLSDDGTGGGASSQLRSSLSTGTSPTGSSATLASPNAAQAVLHRSTGTSPTTSSAALISPSTARAIMSRSGDQASTVEPAQRQHNNNNGSVIAVNAESGAAGDTGAKKKKKRKKKRRGPRKATTKEEGKERAPTTTATTSSTNTSLSTSSSSASAESAAPAMPTSTPLEPVVDRPAVMTRSRQGSVALYASLGQGAVSMLLNEGIYKPPSS